MRFDEWLDAEPGRLKKVAEHFGVSKSAVSQWRMNGVPVDNILPLHEFTERQVSLEELLSIRSLRAEAAEPPRSSGDGSSRPAAA